MLFTLLERASKEILFSAICSELRFTRPRLEADIDHPSLRIVYVPADHLAYAVFGQALCGAGVSSNCSTGWAIALAHPQARSARSPRCPHRTGRRKRMIWKSVVGPPAIAPTAARWSAISGFARKSAETVSDFASIVHNLAMDVRDSYRPELHYMRGPGPKWRAKHQPRLSVASDCPHSPAC
jgi:hypothetical protein